MHGTQITGTTSPIASSFGSQTMSEPVMLGDFSRVGLTNRTKCGLGCFQMSSRGCKKKLRSFTCSPAVSSGTVLAGMIAWGPCAPGRQNKTVSTSHGATSKCKPKHKTELNFGERCFVSVWMPLQIYTTLPSQCQFRKCQQHHQNLRAHKHDRAKTHVAAGCELSNAGIAWSRLIT